MNWLYWGLGGIFLIKLIEKSRLNKFIQQAQQLRTASGKPICLISASSKSPAFDVHIHPNQSLNLPYVDKHFSALVCNAFEEIPDPGAALAEWQRIADKVFVNTHLFLSPEAWLDLRHRHVFMGKKMIGISPAMNWGIAGGLGYYFFYERKKKKDLPMLPALPSAPALSQDNIEEAPLVNPSEIKQSSFNGRLLDIGGALDLNGVEFNGEKLVLDMNMSEEDNQNILSSLEAEPAEVVVISTFDDLPDDEKEATIQIASENLKRGGKTYIPTKRPGGYLGKVRKFFRRAKKQQGYIEAEG